MSRPTTFLLAVLLIGTARAQVSYNDVAVIFNVNDPVSVSIGSYFQAARSIPEVNMIAIDAPLSESIDTAQFTMLRQQIETHLITNGLTDSINYLVCIKGVPHRIGACADSIPNGCDAFDSRLAPLLGPDVDLMQNPFHGSFQHQYRPETGIYLVTRLDGFTQQDVIDLIDRSGPGQLIDMASSNILADISHAPWYVAILGEGIENTLAPLADAGWPVTVDTLPGSAPALSGLVGFMSIELAPDTGAFPHTWAPAALASEVNSFGAYTFDPNEPQSTHRRMAEMIASGATGMRGVVTYAYASIGMQMPNTFKRYLDTTAFNLAESYWAGMPFMNFTDLVIGDPKTSVIVEQQAGVEEEAIAQLAVRYDATNSALTFAAPHGIAGPFLIQVVDALGREVDVRQMRTSEPLVLAGISPGAYVVRVGAGDRLIGQGRFVKPF